MAEINYIDEHYQLNYVKDENVFLTRTNESELKGNSSRNILIQNKRQLVSRNLSGKINIKLLGCSVSIQFFKQKIHTKILKTNSTVILQNMQSTVLCGVQFPLP